MDLSYCWVAFPCMHASQFAFHVPVAGRLDCYQFVALKNKASVNTHVQVLAWTYALG